MSDRRLAICSTFDCRAGNNCFPPPSANHFEENVLVMVLGEIIACLLVREAGILHGLRMVEEFLSRDVDWTRRLEAEMTGRSWIFTKIIKYAEKIIQVLFIDISQRKAIILRNFFSDHTRYWIILVTTSRIEEPLTNNSRRNLYYLNIENTNVSSLFKSLLTIINKFNFQKYYVRGRNHETQRILARMIFIQNLRSYRNETE